MDQEDAHRAKEDDNDQCDSGVMVIRSPDVKYDFAMDDDDVIFDDDEDISRHGRGQSTSGCNFQTWNHGRGLLSLWLAPVWL